MKWYYDESDRLYLITNAYDGMIKYENDLYYIRHKGEWGTWNQSKHYYESYLINSFTKNAEKNGRINEMKRLHDAFYRHFRVSLAIEREWGKM